MKTKHYLLGALAAMMLMTSCQDDTTLLGNEGEVMVSFNLETPQIATRAFSDGSVANLLQYAVYDQNGEQLTTHSGTVSNFTGSATINLKLSSGNSYSAIFWAANENAPYTVNFTDKTMTVNYTNAVSNDETRDAFYKYQEFTVEGNQTVSVELKRPFAQLNIGTNDFDEATAASYAPTQSAVTVKKIANTLNLCDGTVSGEQDVTFGYDTIPAATEPFPVADYQYLAMNYVLVGKDKEVFDIVYKYRDNNNLEQTNAVGSVPMQRNYRTNIYGSLLTNDVKVEVDMEPDYDGNLPGTLEEELIIASQVGGTVTLTAPVTLSKTLNVNADMIINLNGKTITGPSEARDAANNRVHAIVNNANLTINGGTITSPAGNGGSAIYNNADATLTINNVEINGAPIVDDGGWPSYGINNYGTMTINGAKVNTYHGGIATGGNGVTVIEDATVDVGLNTQTKQTSWALYVIDNGALTVNSGTFKNTKNENGQVYGGGYICARSTSKTIINGGIFDKTEGDNNGTGLYYQCQNLEINGGVFDTDPSEYVTDGYTAVDNGNNTWTIAKKITSANIVEVFNNLSTTAPITLALSENITTNESVTIPAGVTVTLDLNGQTIAGGKQAADNTKSIYAIVNNGTLTLKNGTVNARGVGNYGTLIVEDGVYNAVDENGGAAIWNYTGSSVTIKGGTFTGAQTDTAPGASAMHVASGATAIVNGGTFENDADYTYAIISYGNLTVNDATIIGEHGAIAASEGTLTINGGSYEVTGTSTDHVIYAPNGGVIINGGTFTLSQPDASSFGSTIIDGAVVVNGGTFDSVSGALAYDGQAGLVINGGTFLNKATTVYGGDFDQFVAATSTATTNADGSITVVAN